MLTCPHAGCQYNTGQDLNADVNPTVADHIAMLGHHRGCVHEPPPPPPQVQPPPAQNVTRVRPPELQLEEGKIEEPDWEAFLAEWDNFNVAGNLQIGTEKHQPGSVLGETYMGDWDQLHTQLLHNRSCWPKQSSLLSRGGISTSTATNST